MDAICLVCESAFEVEGELDLLVQIECPKCHRGTLMFDAEDEDDITHYGDSGIFDASPPEALDLEASAILGGGEGSNEGERWLAQAEESAQAHPAASFSSLADAQALAPEPHPSRFQTVSESNPMSEDSLSLLAPEPEDLSRTLPEFVTPYAEPLSPSTELEELQADDEKSKPDTEVEMKAYGTGTAIDLPPLQPVEDFPELSSTADFSEISSTEDFPEISSTADFGSSMEEVPEVKPAPETDPMGDLLQSLPDLPGLDDLSSGLSLEPLSPAPSPSSSIETQEHPSFDQDFSLPVVDESPSEELPLSLLSVEDEPAEQLLPDQELAPSFQMATIPDEPEVSLEVTPPTADSPLEAQKATQAEPIEADDEAPVEEASGEEVEAEESPVEEVSIVEVSIEESPVQTSEEASQEPVEHTMEASSFEEPSEAGAQPVEEPAAQEPEEVSSLATAPPAQEPAAQEPEEDEPEIPKSARSTRPLRPVKTVPLAAFVPGAPAAKSAPSGEFNEAKAVSLAPPVSETRGQEPPRKFSLAPPVADSDADTPGDPAPGGPAEGGPAKGGPAEDEAAPGGPAKGGPAVALASPAAAEAKEAKVVGGAKADPARPAEAEPEVKEPKKSAQTEARPAKAEVKKAEAEVKEPEKEAKGGPAKDPAKGSPAKDPAKGGPAKKEADLSLGRTLAFGMDIPDEPEEKDANQDEEMKAVSLSDLDDLPMEEPEVASAQAIAAASGSFEGLPAALAETLDAQQLPKAEKEKLARPAAGPPMAGFGNVKQAERDVSDRAFAKTQDAEQEGGLIDFDSLSQDFFSGTFDSAGSHEQAGDLYDLLNQQKQEERKVMVRVAVIAPLLLVLVGVMFWSINRFGKKQAPKKRDVATVKKAPVKRKGSDLPPRRIKRRPPPMLVLNRPVPDGGAPAVGVDGGTPDAPVQKGVPAKKAPEPKKAQAKVTRKKPPKLRIRRKKPPKRIVRRRKPPKRRIVRRRRPPKRRIVRRRRPPKRRYNRVAAKRYFKRSQGKMMSGNMNGAIKELRRAIRADARYPAPYRMLGMIYKSKGNKPAAKRAWRTYLRLAPKAPMAKIIRKMMNAL